MYPVPSPAVRAAHDVVPPGHQAPDLIEAYGQSLERTLKVWQAPEGSAPFIVPGSGTTAMDMAAANLVTAGTRVLVVNTGYFSQRMMEIVRRYGGEVQSVDAEPGRAVELDALAAAVKRVSPEVIFATHVDTSTGVCMEPCHVAEVAGDALTVFDGVCATAAEPFNMAALKADVYLTGSQKALGLPPGLAFAVFSPRAMARRDAVADPPLVLDVRSWWPIMQAYLERRPSYFATPATNLVLATATALGEILDTEFSGKRSMAGRVALHRHAAESMWSAWEAMGLQPLTDPKARGVTLSALKVPEELSGPVPPAVRERGVTIAGGLYPGLQKTYFRVGHMGYCTTQPAMLGKTVRPSHPNPPALHRPLE
ncbi:MAG: aminotransferase class V-fold PLP-dependent enzyme, partial [Myxococcota bacterium]